MMSYEDILPVWWSMFWRGFIVGLIAGFVAGGVAGFVAGYLGYPHLAGFWGGIAGWIVSILVSIWAVRAAINRHNLRPSGDDNTNKAV